ncbi:MAG: prepilin-type N-terminal cleavage/methylation domain-containing protein [Clostridiales bacterium]|nr:prepilin-type N-terminal cleavage/methylation domain-containing protein [Clostridiales bacterium]
MRRIDKHSKNLRGFTLVEILLVVGIIIILAGAVALGVGDILDPAKRAQSSVHANVTAQSQSINDSEVHLKNIGF